MNISEIFIRRPVATTLVMLAILVFGLLQVALGSTTGIPGL